MKKLILILLCCFCFIMKVSASASYCSIDPEIIGCTINGYLYSNGSIGPLVSEISQEGVEKKVTVIYGCTDSKADNYNPKALKDDKSCVYKESITKLKLFYNMETDIILIGMAIMIIFKFFKK